jgi:hypothetical protein
VGRHKVRHHARLLLRPRSAATARCSNFTDAWLVYFCPLQPPPLLCVHRLPRCSLNSIRLNLQVNADGRVGHAASTPGACCCRGEQGRRPIRSPPEGRTGAYCRVDQEATATSRDLLAYLLFPISLLRTLYQGLGFVWMSSGDGGNVEGRAPLL